MLSVSPTRHMRAAWACIAIARAARPVAWALGRKQSGNHLLITSRCTLVTGKKLGLVLAALIRHCGPSAERGATAQPGARLA